MQISSRRTEHFLRLTTVFLGLILFVVALPAKTSGAEDEADVSAQPTSGEEVPSRDYVVWPLVFREETPSWRQFSFIPIYVHRRTTDDYENRVQMVWPIFLYKRFDRDMTIHLFPFFWYWRDVYAYKGGEERDFDYMMLPFVFGGGSSERGRYFALFPLYGTLRGYFGRDRVRFILFPLYMDYLKNEFYQRNYLWPVLSFSEGGGYNGFRFWPFYGYIRKEGEYRKKFVLWPFFHSQEFDLDKEQTGRRMLILPVYAMEESRRRDYHSILWPFFSREEDYVQNYKQYTAPWPFVVVARGDIYKNQYWPFYGYEKKEDSETTFIAWPFWRQREYELSNDLKRQEVSLLPFLSRNRLYDSEGVKEEKSRFWPLWRSRRFEDGSSDFRIFSLLWFDDERGFERQYAPLWTVFERKDLPNGERDTRALWGLIHQERSSTRSEMSVPLIFKQIRDSERDFSETTILGGLFSAKSEMGDVERRILYVIKLSSEN